MKLVSSLVKFCGLEQDENHIENCNQDDKGVSCFAFVNHGIILFNYSNHSVFTAGEVHETSACNTRSQTGKML